jgi:hypothetical protein
MKNETTPSPSDFRVETGLCFDVLWSAASILVDSADVADVTDLLASGALTWENRSRGVLALTYLEGSEVGGFTSACVASISASGRVAFYV